jgi:rSAM/selenodomain-associated transferase 1
MRRVALFARVPEPGRVKSRLSPALPPAAAAALYRGMLLDAVAAVRAAPCDERFVYWADRADPGLSAGLGPRVQSEGDLGARLAAAFAELLAARGDAAVICGADNPHLGGGDIEHAFGVLGGADVAIAPALDGGYSLIGLAHPAPGLFRGIAWGGISVLEETRERAASLGLRVATLDPLDDVDTAEDVCRLVAWAATDTGPRGRHTREAMRELGLLPPA